MNKHEPDTDDLAWRYDERRDHFELMTQKKLERRRFWRIVLFFLVAGCTSSAFMVLSRISN
jgi:hypothetical protein